MKFYQPNFIKKWLKIYKEDGFKIFIKKKGIKVVLVVIIFYLIRDSFLYIFLPYIAFTKLNLSF